MENSSKANAAPLGKNSQELRLKKIVHKSVAALILGGFLLAISIAANFYVMLVEEDQLETTPIFESIPPRIQISHICRPGICSHRGRKIL